MGGGGGLGRRRREWSTHRGDSSGGGMQGWHSRARSRANSYGCTLCTPSKAISRHRQSGKVCPAIHPRLQWHLAGVLSCTQYVLTSHVVVRTLASPNIQYTEYVPQPPQAMGGSTSLRDVKHPRTSLTTVQLTGPPPLLSEVVACSSTDEKSGGASSCMGHTLTPSLHVPPGGRPSYKPARLLAAAPATGTTLAAIVSAVTSSAERGQRDIPSKEKLHAPWLGERRRSNERCRK